MAHASLPESPAPAPRRWRGLLALGLLVAAVHLLLLQAMPLPRHSSDIAPPMAFSTRTITLNPPPAPAPPPAAAAPPAKPAAPARPARPRPRPALPPATVAEAPALPEPAPQEAPATPVAEAPPPAPEPAPAASVPVVAEAPAEPLPQVPAGAPITIPGSVRLLYDVQGQVKKMDYKARSELLWRQDGSQYDLRFEVSAFLVGSRVQTSRGKLTTQGLAPERFSDKSRNERAAHFNYDQGKVTFSANSPDAPLAAGMQDRLSVFIQLGALLYGLWSVLEARPVHTVFEYDRLRVVHAADVPEESVGRAPKALQALPLTGPTWLALRPLAASETMEMTLAALNGVPLGARPELWRPYESERAAVLKAARPAAELATRFPTQSAMIDRALAEAGKPADALVYLPLQARKDTVWTALLDRETAKPLAYLPLDSF